MASTRLGDRAKRLAKAGGAIDGPSETGPAGVTAFSCLATAAGRRVKCWGATADEALETAIRHGEALLGLNGKPPAGVTVETPDGETLVGVPADEPEAQAAADRGEMVLHLDAARWVALPDIPLPGRLGVWHLHHRH